jgi:fructose-1,6-bisphosphatase
MSICGKTPTLDVQPKKLHERVPLVLGSSDEVKAVMRHISAS